jgi:hypothetical protein
MASLLSEMGPKYIIGDYCQWKCDGIFVMATGRSDGAIRRAGRISPRPRAKTPITAFRSLPPWIRRGVPVSCRIQQERLRDGDRYR